MTIYLAFPSAAVAYAALEAAEYTLSEYKDHLQGNGWGVLFPHPNGSSHLANVYDCAELHADLVQYQTPQPLTPYNIRAGDDLQLVYRCVVVTAAIRDDVRDMVVALAGDTHTGMWSIGLSATGQAPATHYINSGPVRVEMAALLDSADALASAAGIDLPTAQYILSQADVSSEDPIAVMSRMGLVAL